MVGTVFGFVRRQKSESKSLQAGKNLQEHPKWTSTIGICFGVLALE